MATFQYNYVFTLALMKFVLYLSLSSLLLFPWKRSHALGYIKFDLTLTTKVFDRPYAAQIFLGPSSYLIHITSITVNTTQISINSSSDQSGIIVNPATFFTTLPMGLYQAMRNEFKEQNNSTVVDFYGAYVSGGMLDLCFNTSEGAAAINIPRVSMTFANDATVELDGEHGIIYVLEPNKSSCLGFMGNKDHHAPGVLGGMQQAKLKVGIDVANQKVGFRRKSSCS